MKGFEHTEIMMCDAITDKTISSMGIHQVMYFHTWFPYLIVQCWPQWLFCWLQHLAGKMEY